MRAKSLVLLVIALGCGMIAAVGVSKAIMDKAPEQAEEASVEIFVAVKDLPHAQKISADSVKLEKWPRSRLPEGALVNLNELDGKYTNQQIFATSHSGVLIPRQINKENDYKNELWIDLEKENY